MRKKVKHKAVRECGSVNEAPGTMALFACASAFYDPFREAVGSVKSLTGDRRSHRMDPANGDQALREMALDAGFSGPVPPHKKFGRRSLIDGTVGQPVRLGSEIP